VCDGSAGLLDGGGCVGWQDRVCEPSTTQTSTAVTTTTATSTTTTLHAEMLRALNISAADLLQANMTVAELRSKGFTASDVLDAGASCTEVEREYGKQPAKCGNSTGLVVAIVVVVVLIMGAAIGVVVWVQHQKGSSQPIDKGRRATRSNQRQQQQQQQQRDFPAFSHVNQNTKQQRCVTTERLHLPQFGRCTL
jgi:uncharacterized protein HemX